LSPVPDQSPEVNQEPSGAYSGQLRAVKGIQVLVDAWAQMEPHQRLVAAGEGGLRDELARRIGELGLGDRAELRGDIDNAHELLREVRVYVQPSFQEGMPNSVLEGMAAGLPVVATRMSGNVDLVTDRENGLLVPPGDASALASAIGRLQEDPALAGRIGECSLQRAQEFGIPAVTARLLQRYRGGVTV
jgi:glycosyltransferase involved in cell wall biosynthesis